MIATVVAVHDVRKVASTMSAPTMHPAIYPAPDAPAAADYVAGQPVWVYRAGAWRPGVVLRSSDQAVMVRYRPADGAGTGVDTVTSESLARREDHDPCLDQAGLELATANGPLARRPVIARD